MLSAENNRKVCKRVLVVDDAVEILMVMRFLLESKGYIVDTAQNGQEALEILNSGQVLPAAIVLDMMMPVMDGPAFRKEQLSDKRLAKIPTIVATALSKNAMEEMNSRDFPNIIAKPIDIDQFLGAIVAVTEDRKTSCS